MRARQRMPSVPRHYVELRVVRAEEEGPFPGQRGPLYQVGDGEGVNFLTGLWFAGVLDFVPGLRRGGVLEFFPT
jgi:hypothetical protein